MNVAGYPALAVGHPEEQTEYLTYGSPYSVYYGSPLGEGSSGGPVWFVTSSGQNAVSGVISAATDQGVGVFGAFSQTTFNQVQTWLAENALPSVTLSNVALTLNNSMPLSTMIVSLNDPNGDTVTGYEVTDEGGDSGYFMVNGAAVGKGQEVYVPLNNLGSCRYVAGSAPGIETIEIAPYDATTGSYTNSILQAFTVTSPHANDLTHSSTASGTNDYIDLLNFEASYNDLITAFGTNQFAMQNWYSEYEPIEHRVETFDGLDYVASYPDLISAFGSAGSMHSVQDAGATHYIDYGHNEGRFGPTFNGLDYIASSGNGDLIRAFGANNDAGAYHYIEYGHSEGRTITFDGLDYIASYGDLIGAFGANEQTGAEHYIGYGYSEGRSTTFDGLAYIANYPDLMRALGASNDAGATHYIDYGHNEGRSTTFNVAGYESAHPDLKGRFSSDDAFFGAYIANYLETGTYLT